MSTYVQHPLINEIDASDAPRFLTFEEIQRIVDNLPENTIPYPKDAEFIRKQIQENIAKELKSQQVCPSGIIEIINEIRKQHKESLLERGTPIGFTSSEAVGAINTQATLNTFHSSGQKNDLVGLQDLHEFIGGEVRIDVEDLTTRGFTHAGDHRN